MCFWKQRYCLTKALVTLLNATQWGNATELSSFGFWRKVTRVADHFIKTASLLQHLNSAEHPQVQPSLPPEDSAAGTTGEGVEMEMKMEMDTGRIVPHEVSNSAVGITPLVCFC